MLNIKTYSAVMKIMRYWNMSGSTIQRNRLENPETEPDIHSN